MDDNEENTNETKLNMKELAFCNYMTAIDTDTWSNRKKSAICAGYSEKSAYNQGTKLLRKDYIIAKINELKAKVFDKMGWDRETCLLEYAHDRTKARQSEQWSTAKDITTKICEIGGFFKQPAIVGNESNLQEMTPKERKAAEAAAQAYNKIMSNGSFAKQSRENSFVTNTTTALTTHN